MYNESDLIYNPCTSCCAWNGRGSYHFQKGQQCGKLRDNEILCDKLLVQVTLLNREAVIPCDKLLVQVTLLNRETVIPCDKLLVQVTLLNRETVIPCDKLLVQVTLLNRETVMHQSSVSHILVTSLLAIATVRFFLGRVMRLIGTLFLFFTCYNELTSLYKITISMIK